MSICEIRESKIHGRGVFATRKIEKGEKLCFYEGKILYGVNSTNSTNSTNLQNTYKLEITLDNKIVTIYGYEQPKSKLGIAQFINDGSSFTPKSTDYKEILKQAVTYKLESAMAANTKLVIIKNKIIAVATKSIEKDEELLLSYDVKYWIYPDESTSEEKDAQLIAEAYYKYILCEVIKEYDILSQYSLHEAIPYKTYEWYLLNAKDLSHEISNDMIKIAKN
jgi:SET domain-containing protein